MSWIATAHEIERQGGLASWLPWVYMHDVGAWLRLWRDRYTVPVAECKACRSDVECPPHGPTAGAVLSGAVKVIYPQTCHGCAMTYRGRWCPRCERFRDVLDGPGEVDLGALLEACERPEPTPPPVNLFGGLGV